MIALLMSSVSTYSRKPEVLTPFRLCWCTCCFLNWQAAEALSSKLCALQKEKQKRAIERREVGNLAGRCDPREGVPVLYLILSLPPSQGLLFIQLSNVWHFLPGGKPDPLFLRAAVSPAQQTSYIHLSAVQLLDSCTASSLHVAES